MHFHEKKTTKKQLASMSQVDADLTVAGLILAGPATFLCGD